MRFNPELWKQIIQTSHQAFPPTDRAWNTHDTLRTHPPGRAHQAPWASAPTRPTKRTAAPRRAAATAWLAPLPPTRGQDGQVEVEQKESLKHG